MSRLWPACLAACLLGLGGCAAAPAPPAEVELPEVMITGLVLVNLSPAPVSAARVLAPATGQFVSCGNIAPRATCATGFPEQRYSGNPIEVTWSQSGRISSTGPLDPELPEAVVEAGRARVRVVILGPDLAAVELEPPP